MPVIPPAGPVIYGVHEFRSDLHRIKDFHCKLLSAGKKNCRLARCSPALSKMCQAPLDLWRVISDGRNAQGAGLWYECVSAGGTGSINEEVPELRGDGEMAHHYQASWAKNARRV